MKKLTCFLLSFFLTVAVALAGFTPDSSPVSVIDSASAYYTVMIQFYQGGAWTSKGKASYSSNVSGYGVWYIGDQLDGYSYYRSALQSSSGGIFLGGVGGSKIIYNSDGTIHLQPIGVSCTMYVNYSNPNSFPIDLYMTGTIDGVEYRWFICTLAPGEEYHGLFNPMFNVDQVDWLEENGLDAGLEWWVNPDWWEDNPGAGPILDPDGDGYVNSPYDGGSGDIGSPGNYTPVYPDQPPPSGVDPVPPSSSPPSTPGQPSNPSGGDPTDPTTPIDTSGIINAIVSSGAGIQSSVGSAANLTVGAVQSLGAKVDSVKTSVSGIGTSISDKLSQVGDSINGGISGVIDSVNALGSGLGNNSGDFAMLGGKIDGVGSDVRGLGGKIDGVKSAVVDLGEKIDGGDPVAMGEFSPIELDDPDTQAMQDSADSLFSGDHIRPTFLSNWLHGFFSLSLPTSVGQSSSMVINFGTQICGVSSVTCSLGQWPVIASLRSFLAAVIGVCSVWSAINIYKGTF